MKNLLENFDKNNILVYINSELNFSIWVSNLKQRLWIFDDNQVFALNFENLNVFANWLKTNLASKEDSEFILPTTDKIYIRIKENPKGKSLLIFNYVFFYGKVFPIESLNTIADLLLALV